ncbi:hypothetical protein ACFE04_012288 [Oxalis oulophora]
MDMEQIPVSKALLILNCLLLAVGACGGELLTRLYFLQGGKRIWFSSWLEQRRPHAMDPADFFLMKPPLFIVSAFIGLITGLVDYLYASGIAHLLVSTVSLIIASRLAFTAGFAYFLVKQKFDYYSINTVFLLTLGAGVLALHTDGNMLLGESKNEYVFGFLMTFGASVLYGFVLPLVELLYNKAKQRVDYTLVMEIQMVMCLFATIFCTVGMIVNNDFKVIPREAREFELGETKYYVLVIITGIAWQCYFIGAIGVIFCSSSLLSAIIIAVLLPVKVVFAVIFYDEKFTAIKGVSLALSLWGLISYLYGI